MALKGRSRWLRTCPICKAVQVVASHERQEDGSLLDMGHHPTNKLDQKEIGRVVTECCEAAWPLVDEDVGCLRGPHRCYPSLPSVRYLSQHPFPHDAGDPRDGSLPHWRKRESIVSSGTDMVPFLNVLQKGEVHSEEAATASLFTNLMAEYTNATALYPVRLILYWQHAIRLDIRYWTEERRGDRGAVHSMVSAPSSNNDKRANTAADCCLGVESPFLAIPGTIMLAVVEFKAGFPGSSPKAYVGQLLQNMASRLFYTGETAGIPGLESERLRNLGNTGLIPHKPIVGISLVGRSFRRIIMISETEIYIDAPSTQETPKVDSSSTKEDWYDLVRDHARMIWDQTMWLIDAHAGASVMPRTGHTGVNITTATGQTLIFSNGTVAVSEEVARELLLNKKKRKIPPDDAAQGRSRNDRSSGPGDGGLASDARALAGAENFGGGGGATGSGSTTNAGGQTDPTGSTGNAPGNGNRDSHIAPSDVISRRPETMPLAPAPAAPGVERSNRWRPSLEISPEMYGSSLETEDGRYMPIHGDEPKIRDPLSGASQYSASPQADEATFKAAQIAHLNRLQLVTAPARFGGHQDHRYPEEDASEMGVPALQQDYPQEQADSGVDCEEEEDAYSGNESVSDDSVELTEEDKGYEEIADLVGGRVRPMKEMSMRARWLLFGMFEDWESISSAFVSGG